MGSQRNNSNMETKFWNNLLDFQNHNSKVGLLETAAKRVIQGKKKKVSFTTTKHKIKPQKHTALWEYFELTRNNVAMQSSLINCNLHSSVIYKDA